MVYFSVAILRIFAITSALSAMSGVVYANFGITYAIGLVV